MKMITGLKRMLYGELLKRLGLLSLGKVMNGLERENWTLLFTCSDNMQSRGNLVKLKGSNLKKNPNNRE